MYLHTYEKYNFEITFLHLYKKVLLQRKYFSSTNKSLYFLDNWLYFIRMAL